jgi:hypothetical protein
MDWCDGEDLTTEFDDFAETIAKKVPIVEVLTRFGIELTECRSGDFTHKARCPLPKHANGGERTASFYASETNNGFYCFGCGSGHNVIQFVEMYTGRPFNIAAKWLGEQFGIFGADGDPKFVAKRRSPEEMPITYIHKAGLEIRDFLLKVKGTPDYKKWCVWADKRFETLDELLDKIEKNDWEEAKEFCDKVGKFLKNKAPENNK